MREPGIHWLVAALLAVAALTGCAGKAKEVAGRSEEIASREIPLPAKPEWVLKGSGVFSGQLGKVISGVGSASGIRSPSLLAKTADNRARAEIARILQTYTAVLLKDYSASAAAKNPDLAGVEHQVEQTVKTFSEAELAGAEIVDHWQDPESGELFSHARLEMSSFEKRLKNASELSEAVRNRVIESAQKAFEETSREKAR